MLELENTVLKELFYTASSLLSFPSFLSAIFSSLLALLITSYSNLRSEESRGDQMRQEPDF